MTYISLDKIAAVPGHSFFIFRWLCTVFFSFAFCDVLVIHQQYLHLTAVMSIAAILNTGLSPATSVAVANFTSKLTAIANLPQSATNGRKGSMDSMY